MWKASREGGPVSVFVSAPKPEKDCAEPNHGADSVSAQIERNPFEMRGLEAAVIRDRAGLVGGPRGIRTHDHRLKRPML